MAPTLPTGPGVGRSHHGHPPTDPAVHRPQPILRPRSLRRRPEGLIVRCVVLQTSPVFGEVSANVEALADLISETGPADLMVAPELATTGYDIERLATMGRELAEPIDGPTTQKLSRLAIENELTLVCGVLESDGDDLFDTVVVCLHDGSIVPYRKTHLYPAERDVFTPGGELLTVPTPDGALGPMICFEHAFPEIATTLALAGAEIIVIPSAVPNGFEHLLELRSRARAQDNQVFVIAANLAGSGFCGRSLVVDPRGEVLSEAGAEATTLAVELDRSLVEEERRTEPALELRRPDLYS
ncbi:MAG: carbon-nitrogen hydrolase [Acidimicrobiia bacterium]|nr:carbon-nitrogen hydrolase [Acidimicrobiia bacterium]